MIVSVSGNFSSSKSKSQTVGCPGSKVVVGGGVKNGDGTPSSTDIEKKHVSSSYPSSSTQWTGTMFSQDQSSGEKWTVYAICVDP